jgi:hypothetical protein
VLTPFWEESYLWPCEKLRCLLYEYFNHISFTYIGVHKLDADALSDCFEFERIEKAKDLARSVFFFLSLLCSVEGNYAFGDSLYGPWRRLHSPRLCSCSLYCRQIVR